MSLSKYSIQVESHSSEISLPSSTFGSSVIPSSIFVSLVPALLIHSSVTPSSPFRSLVFSSTTFLSLAACSRASRSLTLRTSLFDLSGKTRMKSQAKNMVAITIWMITSGRREPELPEATCRAWKILSTFSGW